MHDVIVEFKDGRKLVGPLWTWRPEEGYMELAVDNWQDGKVFFRDVRSATNLGIRVTIDRIEDVDLLARAKKEGWDGK